MGQSQMKTKVKCQVCNIFSYFHSFKCQIPCSSVWVISKHLTRSWWKIKADARVLTWQNCSNQIDFLQESCLKYSVELEFCMVVKGIRKIHRGNFNLWDNGCRTSIVFGLYASADCSWLLMSTKAVARTTDASLHSDELFTESDLLFSIV